MPTPAEVAVTTFDCPQCKAAKGARCKTATGTLVGPHARRFGRGEGVLWQIAQQPAPTPVPTVPPAARTTAFRPLAIGAGGYLTGISMSDDGKLRLARTDTQGGYRLDATANRWVQVITAAGMPLEDRTPNGAGMLGLTAAPSDSTRAYGQWRGKLYRSDDGARTWRTILADAPGDANGEARMWGPRLVVDPKNPDHVLLGTTTGLQRTTDGGKTWTKPLTTKSALGVTSIAFDPINPATVYAAPGDGIYVSRDTGATFTAMTGTGLAAVRRMHVSRHNGDVYATGHTAAGDIGSGSVVRRLRNGTWTTITPSGQQGFPWTPITEDPTTPGRIVTFASGVPAAVSLDYGTTWARPTRTMDGAGDVPWIAWAMNNGGDWFSYGDATFDPTVPGRLWLPEGMGVWYADLPKDPAGTHAWHSAGRGIEQLTSNTVMAAPAAKPIVTAWDRPMFRSVDPDTYPATVIPGPKFSAAWSIDYSAADPAWMVASVANHQWPSNPAESCYSTDAGLTWAPLPSIPGGSSNAQTMFGFGTVAAGKPGNIVWVPWYGKRPQFTLDGGKTWTPVTLPGVTDYSGIASQGYWVNRHPLAADKVTAGTFYLYAHGNGWYRSTDGGATWTQRTSTPFPNGWAYVWHLVVKASPVKAGSLLCSAGRDQGDQPLMLSIDGAATWTPLPITGVTAFGYGAPFPGSSHATIYAAGTAAGVYGLHRSTDNGTTWTLLTDYPTGALTEIRWVDGDKTTPGRVYLGLAGSGWAVGELAAA